MSAEHGPDPSEGSRRNSMPSAAIASTEVTTAGQEELPHVMSANRLPSSSHTAEVVSQGDRRTLGLGP